MLHFDFKVALYLKSRKKELTDDFFNLSLVISVDKQSMLEALWMHM